MKKMFVIILVLFLSQSLLANDFTIYERVKAPLTKLIKLSSIKPASKAAKEMLSGSSRVDLFTLQSLGRLLDDKNAVFKKIKNAAKEMEDAVGEAKKWQDMLGQDNLSLEKQKRYQDKLNSALAALAQLIKGQWRHGDYGRELLAEVEGDEWSQGSHTNYLLKGLSKELKDILEKDYDFIYGEEGNGLHELRRNLRWPVIEMEALKDLFRLRDDLPCKASVLSLVNLGKKSRYSVLKDTEGEMELSACAYYALVGSVEKLGEIKDELEKKEKLEDKLPQDIRKNTIQIYRVVVGYPVDNDKNTPVSVLERQLEE